MWMHFSEAQLQTWQAMNELGSIIHNWINKAVDSTEV